MPQRFLKPGITDSDKWNRVAWPAQSLYIRLLTLVDDYGRYDGRPAVIWARSFAVYNDANPSKAVTVSEVAGMLGELAGIGLIEMYEADGKPILAFTGWTERIRDGVKERWPAKSCNTLEINPAQKLQEVAGSCRKFLPSSSSSSSSSTPPSLAQTVTPSGVTCESHLLNDVSADDIYSAYPRKVGRGAAVKAITKAMKRVCPACLLKKTQAYATARAGEDQQFTPYPATWFGRESYNDEPTAWKSTTNGKPRNPSAPANRNTGTANEQIDFEAYGRAAH